MHIWLTILYVVFHAVISCILYQMSITFFLPTLSPFLLRKVFNSDILAQLFNHLAICILYIQFHLTEMQITAVSVANYATFLPMTILFGQLTDRLVRYNLTPLCLNNFSCAAGSSVVHMQRTIHNCSRIFFHRSSSIYFSQLVSYACMHIQYHWYTCIVLTIISMLTKAY